MAEEKSPKPKSTKLLAILIGVLGGVGVLLITFSLLLHFGILGSNRTVVAAGENEEETAAVEESNIPVDIIPMTVDEAYEAYNSGEGYVFLDVRSEDEYKSGHMEGAIFIPVSELGDRLNELSRDKPIIVYCKAGVRSAKAATILVENGFTQVYDMGGGITEWVDKGYPTVSSE